MKFLRAAWFVGLLLASVWACAALWFDGPASRGAAGALAIAFAGAVLAMLLGLRPRRRGRIGVVLLFCGVLGWWLSLAPSHDRAWSPDVAYLPTASVEGDRVRIRNVRNFTYRSETDFDPRWEERTIDLSKVTGIDFTLSYWGSPWIAHTIVSWSFKDAPPLAISIETRKEVHETYSAILGFFRQYELYYVVADERDLLGLRTHHRGEDLYLYRLETPPGAARALLVEYLEAVDRLAREPQWYNAATHNCTTTIRRHLQSISAGNPFDWRILVNGRIDRLGYERGTIDRSLPFEELRRRSAISARAREKPIDAGFSARIREGLPLPPGRTARNP